MNAAVRERVERRTLSRCDHVTALTEIAYEAAETGQTVDVRAKIEDARDAGDRVAVE